MTCPDFEKLIALDVEGDLPQRKAARLGEHLEACRNCQEFKEKLQASQALLKSLAQEAADEAALREVRQRVLYEISSDAAPHRFLAWRFALGAALVATVILVAVTLWRPRGHGIPNSIQETKRAATEAVRPAPTAPQQAQVRTEKAEHVLRPRKQLQGLLTASVEPRQATRLTIKLVTDDPNVVIYWLVD